ncbi:MAG TPA: hypothetical protein VGH74_17100, partial [Planctomycetaceae bacterium]
MSTICGRIGPAFPRLGQLVYAASRAWYRAKYARNHLYDPDSPFALERIESMRNRISRGEEVYLAGLGVAGHNSGAALLKVSAHDGILLLSNDEEERFSAVKHHATYPTQSLDCLTQRLAGLGLTPRDLHAVLLSWNYASITSLGYRTVAEHFPASLKLARDGANTGWDFYRNGKLARQSPARLAEQFGLERPQPLIGMPHHENHAAFSYAVSPFNRSDEPVMIT